MVDQVGKWSSPIFAVAPGNPHCSSFSVCRPVVTHGSGCMSILEQCFVYIHTVYTCLTAQLSGVCLFQICVPDIVGVPIGVSLFINPRHACAAKAVLGLSFCLSVRLSVTTFSPATRNKTAKKRYQIGPAHQLTVPRMRTVCVRLPHLHLAWDNCR